MSTWYISAILLVQISLSGYALAEADHFKPDEGASSFQFGIVSNVNESDSETKSRTDSTQSITVADVLIVIRSQHNAYHKRKAENLAANLKSQALQLPGKGELDVKMTHEDWAPFSAWTILSIVHLLNDQYATKKKWVFFCEDSTQIHLERLLDVLGRFNSKEEVFVGHGLRDREPAIIHHFAFIHDPSQFAFPDFAAGWAITQPLLATIHNRLSKNPPEMDFTIDVQHEIAMYIYNGGKGVNLTDIADFCINRKLNASDCATTAMLEEPGCGEVPADEIFVAVKTCEKFHSTRLPVILQTIGKDAKHIVYYSDQQNASIPTEFIGVNNTERGHCAKLHKIIKRSHDKPEIKGKSWVVVIDDDTIISFSRLQRALACYNPKDPILLGERYGYGINYEDLGYEYITGGGGMILSRAGVTELLESECECSSEDAPDDMWLGMCFRRLNIPLVHSYSYHQARPGEYAEEILQHQFIVSFHKHYMLDPMQVYKDYLIDADNKTKS